MPIWKINFGFHKENVGHESIPIKQIYTYLDRDFLRKTLEQFHAAFE